MSKVAERSPLVDDRILHSRSNPSVISWIFWANTGLYLAPKKRGGRREGDNSHPRLLALGSRIRESERTRYVLWGRIQSVKGKGERGVVRQGGWKHTKAAALRGRRCCL